MPHARSHGSAGINSPSQVLRKIWDNGLAPDAVDRQLEETTKYITAALGHRGITGAVFHKIAQKSSELATMEAETLVERFERVDAWLQKGGIQNNEYAESLQASPMMWELSPHLVIDRLGQAAEFYKAGHCYLRPVYGNPKSDEDIEPFLRWGLRHPRDTLTSRESYGLREMLLSCPSYITPKKGHPRNILTVHIGEMSSLLQEQHGSDFEKVLSETMGRRLANPQSPLPKAEYKPSHEALAMRAMRARRTMIMGSV